MAENYGKDLPTDLGIPSWSPTWGEIFSTIGGVPLHTAFHYRPLIVLICYWNTFEKDEKSQIIHPASWWTDLTTRETNTILLTLSAMLVIKPWKCIHTGGCHSLGETSGKWFFSKSGNGNSEALEKVGENWRIWNLMAMGLHKLDLFCSVRKEILSGKIIHASSLWASPKGNNLLLGGANSSL